MIILKEEQKLSVIYNYYEKIIDIVKRYIEIDDLNEELKDILSEKVFTDAEFT